MEEKIRVPINIKVGQEPSNLPALVLAYIGDAVYELHIRAMLVARGITKVNDLHKEAVKYVRAEAQARLLHSLEGTLSPEEAGVVRRGRNAKSGKTPKHTEMIDYRYSTAFEALVGYLCLMGNEQRLSQIFEQLDQLISDQNVDTSRNQV